MLEGVVPQPQLPDALASTDVHGIAFDSRKVEPGYLFFAFPGAKADGRQFVSEAIAKGRNRGRQRVSRAARLSRESGYGSRMAGRLSRPCPATSINHPDRRLKITA